MKRLIAFDDYLLSISEKFTDWFQIQTGITCISLGKFCLGIIVVLTVIAFWMDELRDGFARTIHYMDFLNLIIYGFVLFRFFDSQDYHAIRRLSQGVKNPLKIDPLVRFVRLYLVILELASVLGTVGLIVAAKILVALKVLMHPVSSAPIDWRREVIALAMIFGLYFTSCDPLPPCNGKATDWLGRLLGRPAADRV